MSVYANIKVKNKIFVLINANYPCARGSERKLKTKCVDILYNNINLNINY